jgi:hypothetical protein
MVRAPSLLPVLAIQEGDTLNKAALAEHNSKINPYFKMPPPPSYPGGGNPGARSNWDKSELLQLDNAQHLTALVKMGAMMGSGMATSSYKSIAANQPNSCWINHRFHLRSVFLFAPAM